LITVEGTIKMASPSFSQLRAARPAR
jgi:hypothetical protein